MCQHSHPKHGLLSTHPNPTVRYALHAERQARLDFEKRVYKWVGNDFETCQQQLAQWLQGWVYFEKSFIEREWFSREVKKHSLHRAVEYVLSRRDMFQYVRDWREMVLEWPHTSVEDGTRLAYTESDAKGVADRQTTTTVGKYIRRHCPDMPDTVLRVINETSSLKVEFLTEMSDMVDAILTTTARSCMSGDIGGGDDEGEDEGYDAHPYRAYDPKYGWHMAVVRGMDGIVASRAVCLDHPEKGKMFVRTFKYHPSGVRACEFLQTQLKAAGYIHASKWPEDQKLALLTDGYGGLRMPYLDGDNQYVDTRSTCVVIAHDGEYECTNTDGSVTYRESSSCDCCGDRTPNDDLITVGYRSDTYVCDVCYENEYVDAYGRNGERYAIKHRYAISVGDDWYDEDYLTHNDIEKTVDANGDFVSYAHIDDTVLLICGSLVEEYTTRKTTTPEREIVELSGDSDGEYAFLEDENVWRCEGTGEYYYRPHATITLGRGRLVGDEPVELDGALYHVDALPEVVEASEAEAEAEAEADLAAEADVLRGVLSDAYTLLAQAGERT